MTEVHIEPERLFAHSARVQEVSSGFSTLEKAAQSTENYDLSSAYGVLCNPWLTPSIKTTQTEVIAAIRSFRAGIERLAGMPTLIGRTMAERDERNATEIAAATRKLLGITDPVPMPKVTLPGTSDPMPRVPAESKPVPMPRM